MYIVNWESQLLSKALASCFKKSLSNYSLHFLVFSQNLAEKTRHTMLMDSIKKNYTGKNKKKYLFGNIVLN